MIKGVNPNKIKREKKNKLITFMQAFESRMAAKSERLSPRTVEGYEVAVERYIPDWKNKALENITKNMVMERYGEITKKHGATSATRTMRVLR